MANIDIMYWKMAIGCFLIAVMFFFFTTDNLVKGKFNIPAWVFSIFTISIGIFFLKVFTNSVNEFSIGRHVTLDQVLDAWEMVLRFVGPT